MSSDVAIRVRDVSKHYLMFERPEDRLKQMIVPRLQRLAGRPPKRYFQDFAALSGISFEVGRGETVGIIGRNGCGKSTLLQIVCGTLQPSTGTVEVNGRIAALLELGAGFNPEFTGRENVYMNAAILGLSRAETDARFDDIARFADIGIFIDQPVKTYSSGMYVRLAFAVAINVDPDILVVDEALAVGDEAFQRKCFARIEDIKDKGGTILFVSHGAQTIIQLCDRAMLFDRGEKILEGRPKTVVSQYQRLVNASKKSAGEIRRQIVASRIEAHGRHASQSDYGGAVNSQLGLAETESVALGAEFEPEAALAGLANSNTSGDDGLADYFDEDLVSQSVMANEERGARIDAVVMCTLSHRPVNVLSRGKRYKLVIDVTFLSPARDIAFGFAIKTATGLIIAGANNREISDGKFPSVEANQRIRATFEFICVLLPGVYFIGASVFGRSISTDPLMNRVVDALAFRVAFEPHLLSAGFADLSPSLQVERRDSNVSST